MKPIERRLNVFFYEDYVGQLLQVQGGLAISYALPIQKERLTREGIQSNIFERIIALI